MQKALSPVRRAVQDYNMINDGDKIAVGVSGGKDSVLLLVALKHLSEFYPKKFEVTGITLDMNVPGADYTPIQRLCERENIPYIIKSTKIYDIVFNVRKEQNPCSLCANLRRGALNNAALELGINKIALGHHNDDAIETFMLNLIHEGRIGCFSPVTYLDRKKITIIRPLLYMTEGEVRSCVKRNALPVVHNACPANGFTQRQEVKEFLQNLEHEHRGVKARIFGAMQRADIDGWLPLDGNEESDNS